MDSDTFQVSYEEWMSYYPEDREPEDTAAPPQIQGELIIEEVDLIEKREAWMIGAIRRIKTEELKTPR